MSLLSSLLPKRMTRRTFKYQGFKATVWQGHRVTEKTFEEFHENDLYLLEGTHQDMLREKHTPRMICAIRNPWTNEILAYTLLIDGGEHFPDIGDKANGVLGMLGTFTPDEHRGKGYATIALQLMAQEIMKFNVKGTWTERCSVYVQYHVHSSFSKILALATNEKLAAYKFTYLDSLERYADKTNQYSAPHYCDEHPNVGSEEEFNALIQSINTCISGAMAA
jgi:hypothetical protein